MKIEIEATPKLKLAENFLCIVRDAFEIAKQYPDAPQAAKQAVGRVLVVDYTDEFSVYVGGSHIAVHEQGSETRLLLITFPNP